MQTLEYIRRDSSHELMARHLRDGARFIPRERKRERQRDAHQEIILPARVEGVVGQNILEDVAEGCADLVEALGIRRSAVEAGEFVDTGYSVIIERFLIGRRFGL